jgi:hypothetical protein
MTHSLGLVRIPVPDNGLGRQSPSYASDLVSSHNGLDNGSLPCRRETGEEDHGLDKFWELGLIGGQIRVYSLQVLKLGAGMRGTIQAEIDRLFDQVKDLGR